MKNFRKPKKHIYAQSAPLDTYKAVLRTADEKVLLKVRLNFYIHRFFSENAQSDPPVNMSSLKLCAMSCRMAPSESLCLQVVTYIMDS